MPTMLRVRHRVTQKKMLTTVIASGVQILSSYQQHILSASLKRILNTNSQIISSSHVYRMMQTPFMLIPTMKKVIID